MLASRYSDDEERGKAMNYALGGLNFGLLIGAPFAGVVYQFTGKPGPFLIVCGLIALIAGRMLWTHFHDYYVCSLAFFIQFWGIFQFGNRYLYILSRITYDWYAREWVIREFRTLIRYIWRKLSYLHVLIRIFPIFSARIMVFLLLFLSSSVCLLKLKIP